MAEARDGACCGSAAALSALLRAFLRPGFVATLQDDGSFAYEAKEDELPVPPVYHDGVVHALGPRPFQAEILGGGPPGLRWVAHPGDVGASALAAACIGRALAWGAPDALRRQIRELEPAPAPVVLDLIEDAPTVTVKRLGGLRLTKWR